MYVYKKSEPGLWTVGYYAPDGSFHPESDWPSPKEAAARVHWLNGGEALPAKREYQIKGSALDRDENKKAKKNE
jgi:hypothetical protein